MADTFKIYKGSQVIAEGESPLQITGVGANTEVAAGEYQAVRVEDERESEKVDIPAFSTLPIEVTGVSLSQQTMTLEVGAEGTLTATVEPPNATDKTVRYTTSDRDIATVSSSGAVRTVTGVGPGTTTITAKAGEQSAVCTVTVEAPEPPPEPEPDPEPDPEEDGEG